MSGATATQPPPRSASASASQGEVDGSWQGGGRRPMQTPDVLRRISLVVAGVCLLAGLVGSLAASAFAQAATTVRDSTGPVLVTTQTLVASLAEADAAATAAFVGGLDEDPIARRSYVDALERATAQVEQVSGLIGDDDAAHDALQDLGASITRYAGLVEAARATNLAGLGPEAEDYLLRGIALLEGEVRDATSRLEAATRLRLDADADRLGQGLAQGSLFLVLALGALVAGQVALAFRTRRILNLPLVLATVAVGGAVAWSSGAVSRAGNDFDDARIGAYTAIEESSRVQDAAFGAKGAETVALITRSSTARQRADDLQAAAEAFRVLTVDGQREAARLDEADVRWSRYLDAVRQLRRATSAESEVAIVAGPLSQAFNGFIFQMEGVLADNRDQFLDGLDRAAARTDGLPIGILVLPILAAGLALAGFQQRIGEYR